MIDIVRVAPGEPQVAALIAQLDAYQLGLYGAECCHLDSLEELSSPHVVMLGACRGSEIVGVGAIKLLPGYGELKRVIVASAQRGAGIGRRLVLSLEAVASANGLSLVKCETGVRQAEALELYTKLGYTRTAAFGCYEENGVSVFLAKTLLPPEGTKPTT